VGQEKWLYLSQHAEQQQQQSNVNGQWTRVKRPSILHSDYNTLANPQAVRIYTLKLELVGCVMVQLICTITYCAAHTKETALTHVDERANAIFHARQGVEDDCGFAPCGLQFYPALLCTRASILDE
jgi:hypothetical protein